MPPLNREIIEFITWAKIEISSIRQWQERRDETQKYFTRLVIGGVVIALITNITGAFFSAAAVVFVVVVNQGKISDLLVSLVR